MRRLAALVLAAAACAWAESPRTEWAQYRVEGEAPWRFARPVEAAGYRVVLSSPDGRILEARVEVDGAPLDRTRRSRLLPAASPLRRAPSSQSHAWTIPRSTQPPDTSLRARRRRSKPSNA